MYNQKYLFHCCYIPLEFNYSSVDFWLRPHQWCQAVGTPLRHFHQWVMNCCLQIEAKMPSRSSVSIKFPIHLWPTHVDRACVFLQLRILQFLSLKRIWGNSINCFRKEKSPNCSAMLVINFSTKWIYLESSCFYFLKHDSENVKFRLNDMFENIKLFLKSDQIKSRPDMFFSLQFYIQVVEVLHYVSQKSNSFPFFIIGFFTFCWLSAKKKFPS